MSDETNNNQMPFEAAQGATSQNDAAQGNPYTVPQANPANPYAAPQADSANPANPYAQQEQPYAQPQYTNAAPQGQYQYQYNAYTQPGQPYVVSSKNKIVAALLAFFLGSLGIHNFYLGKTGRAIAQLLLTVIGWIIIIGPFISGIWAFVEFILILVSKPGSSYHQDGQGLELQD